MFLCFHTHSGFERFFNIFWGFSAPAGHLLEGVSEQVEPSIRCKCTAFASTAFVIEYDWFVELVMFGVAYRLPAHSSRPGSPAHRLARCWPSGPAARTNCHLTAKIFAFGRRNFLLPARSSGEFAPTLSKLGPAVEGSADPV